MSSEPKATSRTSSMPSTFIAAAWIWLRPATENPEAPRVEQMVEEVNESLRHVQTGLDAHTAAIESIGSLVRILSEVQERLETHGTALEGVAETLTLVGERFEKHEEYINTLFTAAAK